MSNSRREQAWALANNPNNYDKCSYKSLKWRSSGDYSHKRLRSTDMCFFCSTRIVWSAVIEKRGSSLKLCCA